MNTNLQVFKIIIDVNWEKNKLTLKDSSSVNKKTDSGYLISKHIFKLGLVHLKLIHLLNNTVSKSTTLAWAWAQEIFHLQGSRQFIYYCIFRPKRIDSVTNLNTISVAGALDLFFLPIRSNLCVYLHCIVQSTYNFYGLFTVSYTCLCQDRGMYERNHRLTCRTPFTGARAVCTGL